MQAPGQGDRTMPSAKLGAASTEPGACKAQAPVLVEGSAADTAAVAEARLASGQWWPAAPFQRERIYYTVFLSFL